MAPNTVRMLYPSEEHNSEVAHLTPHTLHLTHLTHLTPYTLHLTPYTLHLTPHSFPPLMDIHPSLLTPHSSLLTPHPLTLLPSSLHQGCLFELDAFKMPPAQSTRVWQEAQACFERAIAGNTGNAAVITRLARTLYQRCIHQAEALEAAEASSLLRSAQDKLLQVR